MNVKPLTPGQRGWRRFKRNRPAFGSFLVLAVIVGLTLVWPWITPYSPVELSDAYASAPDASIGSAQMCWAAI